MGSAALGCFGAVQPANAQTDIMGGGATFPSVLYRQIMDCIYIPIGNGIDGPTQASFYGGPGVSSFCPDPVNGDATGLPGRQYYAPTGSGNGKNAFKDNSNATLSAISTTNKVPYTSSTVPHYPWPTANGLQFIGSDDSWNPSDVTDWNTIRAPHTATDQTLYGNVIQLPAVAGPVTIPYTGTDAGGNPLATTASNGNINLSRKAICGIFSGHITKWSNTILATDNGVGSVGSGQINVVHRSDGSGTNFLFTSGLAAQCQFAFGPNNETDSTLVSFAFPWTDHNVPTAPQCPTILTEPNGSNQNNWPDQFPTDQCGKAVITPTGSLFHFGSGNSGVIAAVQATPGSIGYSTADQVKPIAPSGPPAANVQSQWDLSLGTGLFQAPNTASVTAAMSALNPTFDPTTLPNPLAWTVQAANPNPGTPGAYPLVGFTWHDIYQCYASGGNNYPVWLSTYFSGLYGATSIGNIINANGFVRPPQVWQVQIYSLLNNPALAPNLSGAGGTGCASNTNGAH
jgi:ABC-type phosphate transport system substrate-binding protein